MPTVLCAFGLRFLIFTADHMPPHVHVKSANGTAKFNIGKEKEVVESTLPPREQRLAESLLEENKENIMNAWIRIHGE